MRKFPRGLCKRIKYFIGDEHKASGEYVMLRRTLRKASKQSKYGVVGAMSRQEAQHRRNLVKIYDANCRRK